MSQDGHTQASEGQGSRVEEVLGGEVIADAERRADRIRQRGQRDAQRIRQRGEEDGRQAAEEILQAARQRAEHASDMVLATVEVEVRKAELAAKEEVIEGCLEAANQQLCGKDGYDYPAVLAELATTAIVQMRGERFVVALAEGGTENWVGELPRRIGEAVEEQTGRAVQVEIAQERPRIAGGCIVLSADGRLRYDNSFGGRLRRARDHLRRVAAQELFPEDEAKP